MKGQESMFGLTYYAIKDVIDHWDVLEMFPYIPNDEYKEYIDKIYHYISIQEKELTAPKLQEELEGVFDFCKGFGFPTPTDPESVRKYSHLLIEQINMGTSEIAKKFGSCGLLREDIYFSSAKVVCEILDDCQKKGASVLQIQSFQLVDEELLPIIGHNWNSYSEVTKEQFWSAYQSNQDRRELDILYRVGILNEENKKLIDFKEDRSEVNG